MSDPYQTLFNMAVKTPNPDGVIQQDVKKILADSPTTNHFCMLALPLKVGGTFLRQAVINSLNNHYNTFLSRGSWASTDQQRDLYWPGFLQFFVSKFEKPHCMLTHSHIHANLPNIDIAETLNIPITLGARNIYDTLVSYYDMVTKPEFRVDWVPAGVVMQTGPEFESYSDEAKRFLLVNTAPVWYARYYRSWLDYTKKCKADGKRGPHWFLFKDLKEDPVQVVHQIVQFSDPAHQYDRETIQRAYDQAVGNKDNLRFNKGVGGRGDAFFTDEEKAHIRKLMVMDAPFEQDLIDLGVI